MANGQSLVEQSKPDQANNSISDSASEKFKKFSVIAIATAAPATGSLLTSFPLIPRVQDIVSAVSVLACALVFLALAQSHRSTSNAMSSLSTRMRAGWAAIGIALLIVITILFLWLNWKYVSVIDRSGLPDIPGVEQPEYITLAIGFPSASIEDEFKAHIESEKEKEIKRRKLIAKIEGESFDLDKQSGLPSESFSEYEDYVVGMKDQYYNQVPRGIAFDTTLLLSILYISAAVLYALVAALLYGTPPATPVAKPAAAGAKSNDS